MSKELIKILAGGKSVSFPEIQLQRYPYPPWHGDKALAMLEILIGFFLAMVYTLFGGNIVKSLTIEKESQAKVS